MHFSFNELWFYIIFIATNHGVAMLHSVFVECRGMLWVSNFVTELVLTLKQHVFIGRKLGSGWFLTFFQCEHLYWLVGWLVGWRVGWLIGSFFGSLIDWLINQWFWDIVHCAFFAVINQWFWDIVCCAFLHIVCCAFLQILLYIAFKWGSCEYKRHGSSTK